MRYLFSFLLFGLIITPAITLAQENFLVGIPGVGDNGDFDGYIQAIYVMFISLAALLAVVKIVIAGVKYMLTDIVPQKTQAKSDIQGALLGLVIVLGAVVILTVINPELTNFNPQQNQIAALEPRSNEINTGTSIANSDQTLEPGDEMEWIRSGGRISSREDCEETYGVVIPESGNVSDRCIIRLSNRQSALPDIASENCPTGRECRAELCNSEDIGILDSCISLCTQRNGIYYDEVANACVYYNDSSDTSNLVVPDPSVTYFLIQNEDQIAAG